jgi:hypothetical protein
MDTFTPPSDLYGPGLPLPVWTEASERIQAGYVAIEHDCAIVAIRVLLVLKNIQPTSCLRDNFEPDIVAYVNEQLAPIRERLVKTFNRYSREVNADGSDRVHFGIRVSDAIYRAYSGKTAGFVLFRGSTSAHMISFLYNFGTDTLDFFHKDSLTGKIVFTSIGADNRVEMINTLIVNLFAVHGGLTVERIYEIFPNAGGSKKRSPKY